MSASFTKFSRATLIVIALLCGFASTAQPPEYFTRERLKGYKKVEVTSGKRSHREGSLLVFTVDNDGHVVRSDHFLDDKLRGWETYEYDSAGRMVSMTTYHELYGYDDSGKKDTIYLSDANYRRNRYQYTGKLLTKIIRTSAQFGSASNDGVTNFEYDSRDRLKTEIYTDSTQGLVGTFRPNTDVIDSMYWRAEPSTRTVTYEYSGTKIICTSRNPEGRVEGYEITTVNKSNQPIRKIEQNNSRVVFRTTSFHYDKKGRLIREKVEFLDRKRIPYDYAAADETEISYNERSLPEIILDREEGKVVSRTRFVYRK